MSSWSWSRSLSQGRETESLNYGKSGNNYALTLVCSLIGVVLFGSNVMVLKFFFGMIVLNHVCL